MRKARGTHIITRMIYGLSGTVALVGLNYIVIDVGGVKYKVYIPLNSEKVPRKGAAVDVFTYHHVTDSGMSLYGFFEEDGLNLFEQLISVSGVGPKTAMAVLSVASIERISAAIARGEPDVLQRSSGIGRKTAERIIVELKDKVFAKDKAVRFAESDQDVYEALLGLGYSRKKVESVLDDIDPKLNDVRDRLKEALKLIRD